MSYNALRYKSYTDSEGNLAEIIDGKLFVTKQSSQLMEETGERTAKTGVTVGDNELSAVSKTDKFGRRTEQSAVARAPENANAPFAMVTAEYTYKQYQKNGEAMAGDRIDTIKNTVKATGKSAGTPYAFAYAYDENNNITHEYAVNENGNRTLRYRYTYDEANQLVRCDDNVVGKTYVYTYNKGGNRISVKTYAYTLGAELGEVQNTNLALYGDLIWRDRMTSFNDKVVFYDSIGNPTSYNGNTYTWEGRQLKSISNSNGKTEFIYDADGLRTETRIYNANNTRIQTDKYIWKDGKIISHTLTTSRKSETVKILYDDNSQPRGYITDSGETILFVKNLQGDVIALVDENGIVRVEYSYDAWGNMTYTRKNGTSYSVAERLVKLCPITYRGYNYDFTTGLYYLQSRYYSPEWGRFLNCDDTNILLSTQGDDHGANLFAYCSNNPVNRVDYTGYWKADIHKQMTYSVGIYFFTEYVAQEIAEADAATDSLFPPFPPLNHPLSGSWNWIQNQSIHFNRNPQGLADSRLVYALIMLVFAARNWANAEWNFAHSLQGYSDRWRLSYQYGESIKYLGYGLHAYQDIEAHGNIGAENYIAQHIVSSNGRYIHKADDIYYSWTDDSKTALQYDPNQTRYYYSINMTWAYLLAFRDLVYMFRNDFNIYVTNSPLL